MGSGLFRWFRLFQACAGCPGTHFPGTQLSPVLFFWSRSGGWQGLSRASEHFFVSGADHQVNADFPNSGIPVTAVTIGNELFKKELAFTRNRPTLECIT
jgi:hypothetical protein